MSGFTPLVPKITIYPDMEYFDYPPKPILQAERIYPGQQSEAICLKWTIRRHPKFVLAGFEVHFYEYTGGQFKPNLWKQYLGEMIRLDTASVLISRSQLNRNRRYFFAVRFMDTIGTCGPFSNPVSIDIWGVEYGTNVPSLIKYCDNNEKL